MSCRQIEELDLAGFLSDPRADAYASFREHYPGCPECASEIRVWTELHLELGDDADAHPAPEELLLFQDDPAGLAPERRKALATHLRSCPSCLEEVRSMESLAPGLGAEIAAARLEPDDDPDDDQRDAPGVAPAMLGAGRFFAPPGGELEDLAREDRVEGPPAGPDAPLDVEVPSVLRKIGRVVWSPTFAYAALIAVTLPLVYLRRDVVVEPVVQEAMAPAAMAPMAPPAPARETDRRFALEEEVRSKRLAKAAPAAPSRPVEARREASEGAAAVATAQSQAAPRLRALGYVASGPGVMLADKGTARLDVVRRGDALVVGVPLSPRWRDDHEITIQVVGSDGRELTQRVSPGPDPSRAEVELPAEWLGAGPKKLRLLDDGVVVETFALVEPPQ